MPNKHPFDDQLRQAFQGFEPEVNAPWDALERELDGVKSAPEPSPANTANRWAVAAAVAAGGALMWLGKPAVDELIVAATEVPSEMRTIQAEPVPWRTPQTPLPLSRLGISSPKKRRRSKRTCWQRT